MNKRIEEFIPEIIELLDNNEWDKIYTKLQHDYIGADIGDFTTYIYEAGIDPLEYLDSVPQHYLYQSTLVNPSIPEGIKEIEHGAFSSSSIENLTVPNSCERAFLMTFVMGGVPHGLPAVIEFQWSYSRS